MKRLITILIFLCILTNYIYSQRSNSNMILLIKYNVNTSCEVLEINGQRVDPKKHFCGDFVDILDGISHHYYPTKRVFYYDGKVELTNRDIILFWNSDLIKQIENLPFKYSNFEIVDFLNDTTIKILYNNREILLTPNENISDTVVMRSNEGSKLLIYRTVTQIENLGLINRENVIDTEHWKEKSLELKLNIQQFVDTMPEFIGGENGLYKYLNEHIEYPTLDSVGLDNTKLFIEFIVDENGEIYMPTIVRSITPTFDNHVVEIFKNMPKWKPGVLNGEAVPIKMVLPINIEMK